jgi:putative hemolysin
LTAAIEFGLVILLILANGIFSMAETAIVSARRSRLQHRVAEGDTAAAKALALSDDPNEFLATTQIGITLIGILSGAFGGAQLSGYLSGPIADIPGIGRYADTLAFVVVVLIITYLSLVVGELVPKRIALNNPEGIAATIAGPMSRLSRIVTPAVAVLSVSTEALLKLLRVRPSEEPPVTAEEVGILLEQGAISGVFEPEERDMTERVFAFADDRVAAIMTPRTEVIWIDTDDTQEELRAKIINSRFSRFPVAHEQLDNLLGVVAAKELLAAAGSGGQLALPPSYEPPFVLPETAPAIRALEQFRKTGQHMAVVIDEYGGVAGVLTLQDILEAIVGDLPEGGGPSLSGAVRRDDGSWLLDGALSIDEVQELLHLRGLPPESERRYETLAGYLIEALRHLPNIGERVETGGWLFEIVDMDGRRIDQVLATASAAR